MNGTNAPTGTDNPVTRCHRISENRPLQPRRKVDHRETRTDTGQTLTIQVNGQVIEGKTWATFNDMTTRITYPFDGVSKSLHIPGFALPYHRFKDGDAITPYGYDTATTLLRELYEDCCFVEALEQDLIVECQRLLEQGAWSSLRQAIRAADFTGYWIGLPILLILFFFTDWIIVDQCRDVIEDSYGRKLPDELVRRLLACAHWQKAHSS